jgi:hypothetical protein
MYREPTSLHLAAIKHASRATRRGNAAEAEHWMRVADYFHRMDDRLRVEKRRDQAHRLRVMEGCARIEKAKRR